LYAKPIQLHFINSFPVITLLSHLYLQLIFPCGNSDYSDYWLFWLLILLGILARNTYVNFFLDFVFHLFFGCLVCFSTSSLAHIQYYFLCLLLFFHCPKFISIIWRFLYYKYCPENLSPMRSLCRILCVVKWLVDMRRWVCLIILHLLCQFFILN
jgi:hypothetical protein